MPTLHLENSLFQFGSGLGRVVIGLMTLGVVLLIVYAPSWQHVLLTLILVGCVACFALFLIEKSKVAYTLTASHFQQHLFKGGWVVKWSDVDAIGMCTYQDEGWHQPLPWVGIKLKRYEPYLDSVCPRIATEILLSQRALLYLGAKQSHSKELFEDMVLNSAPFTGESGVTYTGLQAMLANRMHYQRQFHDFDIFISTQDLDRDGDEFVGLARRYLAAAKRHP